MIAPPTLTYDSADQKRPFIGEFLELVRYRDLLRLMVANTVKARYSRSILGVAWSLMNPLLYMAVLTIAFSNLFRDQVPHYVVYVMASLVCWNFFAATTVHAMNSLVWGGALLKRIYVPRTIFAFAAVGHGVFNFVMSLLPLTVIVLIVGHPLRPALWILPLAILLLTLFVLGVALLVSTLAVFFTDVVEFYQVLLQGSFFLTPIMYPVQILPSWAQALIPFNPMFHLIEMFRLPVYDGVVPAGATIGAAVASSLLALAIGWAVFTRHADELAYRV